MVPMISSTYSVRSERHLSGMKKLGEDLASRYLQ